MAEEGSSTNHPPSSRGEDNVRASRLMGKSDVSVPRGYSISQEYHESLKASIKQSSLESSSSSSAEKRNGPSAPLQSRIMLLWTELTTGGTVFDGFLLAASQEVGQSILTLPNVFSQLGFYTGVILELTFASLALYTNFLLVSMHAQFRHQLEAQNDPRHHDKYYIVSYHEIMQGLVGKWLQIFSLVVVFFALLGLSTVQIIATSSNFYILLPDYSKRTWSIIWGCIFALMAFVPTFRHYRVLSVFGILTTTYTAWFMTIASAIEGPQEDVVYE
mmetsp:Transcript_8713/g.24130  ORF Transcript_8713/g.24130 Transcript_8713/m.24130 type:complete len:274 (-) Transcript_8713:599-1420(-)